MSGSLLTALNPAGTLTGTEPVYVVQGGDKRTTTAAIGALALTPALLAAALATLDLSTLPTTDPGGGKLWLNGGGVAGRGVLQVGS
jgi:hypothetical protein